MRKGGGHALLEPYEGGYHEEVIGGKRYRVRDDEPDFRILQLALSPDPEIARKQLLKFLAQWLQLYSFCRVAADLVAVARVEGKARAREEGYKRGVFVD